MEKTYAQAIFELSKKPDVDAAELVNTFIAHLTQQGRLKLLPRILRELKRLDERSETLGDSIEVASEGEKTAAIAEAKQLGITAEPVVNDTLVTGWRARTGSRIIDRSGKRALLDLYAEITAHA